MEHFKLLFGSGNSDLAKIRPLKNWTPAINWKSSLYVEDIREMGKPPETPNPKPEREMGKREKKPRNQRRKWEKEENGKRKREGEPNGVTTPLPSSKNRDVLYAMG